MNRNESLVWAALIGLTLLGLLSALRHEPFSMVTDYDTGCPHDKGVNLFEGERYGWPFYFIYVGYIERCTTVKPLMPDIRIGFPVQVKTVDITAVQFMNSGTIVWGYWDDSTIQESVGLFASGLSHEDVGHTFEIHFREWPNPDIRRLHLIKKTELTKVS